MKKILFPAFLLISVCSYGQTFRVDSLLEEKQMSRWYLLKDTVNGNEIVRRVDYFGAGRKRSFIGKYYLVTYEGEKRIFKLLN